MYIAAGIFVVAAVACTLLFSYRKRKVIYRICTMSDCEKACRLNELVNPLGFAYLLCQDIIVSLQDAWQREFGYHAFLDRTAPHFNMVFDSEPIYFPYQGRTWLIEFWKGQYGINTGGEVGVYQAEGLLSPEECRSAHFQSAEDSDMLQLAMELYAKEQSLFCLQQRHWWLAGFCMGSYREPEELTMRVSVTCLDEEMRSAFVQGLLKAGYKKEELQICGNKVTILFVRPRHSQSVRKRFSARLSQRKNRMFCAIYCRATNCFCCTADRLLYLYYMIPFAFRRMLRLRRMSVMRCKKGGERHI